MKLDKGRECGRGDMRLLIAPPAAEEFDQSPHPPAARAWKFNSPAAR